MYFCTLLKEYEIYILNFVDNFYYYEIIYR